MSDAKSTSVNALAWLLSLACAWLPLTSSPPALMSPDLEVSRKLKQPLLLLDLMLALPAAPLPETVPTAVPVLGRLLVGIMPGAACLLVWLLSGCCWVPGMQPMGLGPAEGMADPGKGKGGQPMGKEGMQPGMAGAPAARAAMNCCCCFMDHAMAMPTCCIHIIIMAGGGMNEGIPG